MYGDKLLVLKEVVPPWWTLPGLIVGMIASSLMIVYCYYRLSPAMFKKGWKYTSRLLILVWGALFFGSATVLLRILTIIQEESIIDNMLMYTSAILYWIAPMALVIGMMLDAFMRVRQVERDKIRRDKK